MRNKLLTFPSRHRHLVDR